MKNMYGLLCLSLVGCAPAVHVPVSVPVPAPWTTFVDGRVSVSFPTQPHAVDPQRLGVAALHPAGEPNGRPPGYFAQDAQGTYLLLVINAVRPVHPADSAARRAFYDDFCRNYVKRGGGTVLARSYFPTAAGDGTEFKYSNLDVATGRQVVNYVRQVLVGQVNYTLSFIPSDRTDTAGVAGSEQRRRFFSSLAVSPMSNK